MAKITIEDDEGNTLESDTFVAVILERDDEICYSRSFSAVRHLDLSGHMIVATALATALTNVMNEVTENSGAQLLYEHTEFHETRRDTDEEDDG